MIAIKDLHLTLSAAAGPVKILNGVSLDVTAGEAVGLVGPSGSGKSTLMMVIAGLEKASSGSVVVAGHNFVSLGEDALASVRRQHIGIVFQSFHLIPTMTAL
ncbi:MAG TPA: ABC transporter, partial [Alphaproteobacteria bacterium]|nr:ABC transporter [Alphaproteobacteria bacterium]